VEVQAVATPAATAEAPVVTPKRTRTRKAAAAVAQAEAGAATSTPVETVQAAPKRTRTRKSPAAGTTAEVVVAAPVVAIAADEPEAPAPAPKRTRSRKAAPAAAAAPTVEAAAAPVAEATPAPVTAPETAPKRRTRKAAVAAAAPAAPVEAVAAPAPEAPAVEAKPQRTRTRKAVVAAIEAAPVVEAPAVEAAPAPKRTRTRKAAAEAAPVAETAAVEEIPADFVPTITRVRINRRGERVVTSEKTLPPGELRRRRRLRREQLAAGLTSGTPSPLAVEPEKVEAFGGLMLSAPVARALDEMQYRTPTEIQEKTIPLLLEGKDVVGQAQTGTGKTAAFGIPLVERIDTSMLVVQALVLAPTRELASQIALELGKIGRWRGVRVAAIYGGASMGAQLSDLKRGAQVVVGTPGRILDHLKRGTLSFESVHYLVLDEADRMLDMGFMPDVERILRRTPRARQTAMFSATVPTVVRIISRRHMRDAVTVQVKPEERTVTAIEQVYYEVAERDKPEALRAVLAEQKPERAMVFCRTQIAVDRLTRILRRDNYPVEAIHGSMGQGQRERVIADFRRGAVSLLIATNLAARGLDIPEVSHVINYDIPEESESYVHRIGRTARMGREGMAITFVAEWDEKSLAEIKKVANGALREERLSLYA
jgi:ATP-dependent RNA helicase DeaD